MGAAIRKPQKRATKRGAEKNGAGPALGVVIHGLEPLPHGHPLRDQVAQRRRGQDLARALDALGRSAGCRVHRHAYRHACRHVRGYAYRHACRHVRGCAHRHAVGMCRGTVSNPLGRGDRFELPASLYPRNGHAVGEGRCTRARWRRGRGIRRHPLAKSRRIIGDLFFSSRSTRLALVGLESGLRGGSHEYRAPINTAHL